MCHPVLFVEKQNSGKIRKDKGLARHRFKSSLILSFSSSVITKSFSGLIKSNHCLIAKCADRPDQLGLCMYARMRDTLDLTSSPKLNNIRLELTTSE